jgi:hypothetical protein
VLDDCKSAGCAEHIAMLISSTSMYEFNMQLGVTGSEGGGGGGGRF